MSVILFWLPERPETKKSVLTPKELSVGAYDTASAAINHANLTNLSISDLNNSSKIDH